jgi:uncharacterized RDD family membrane protein YckC
VPLVVGAEWILGVIGAVAVCFLIGKKVAPQLSQTKGLSSEHVPLAWIVLGTVICWVLYSIPVIGFLAATLVSVLGLGGFALYLLEKTKIKPPPALSQQSSAAATAGSLALSASPDLTSHPTTALYPATLNGPAEFVPRLLANIIDIVLLFIVLNTAHLTRYTFILWALYRFGMYIWRSATLGEIILGLQVRTEDGHLLCKDISTSALRALASLTSLLPLGLGFFWILFDPQKQTWHDKISRTHVVRIGVVQELRRPAIADAHLPKETGSEHSGS